MTKTLLALFFIVSAVFANPLQCAIDDAQAYSTLKLPSGIYLGNIVINKPLTIVGKDKNAIIDGDGHGCVITINSSHVTLKNLTIANSGNKMDKIDSAIAIKNANHCEIDSCLILNTLYGIDMFMVNDSIVSNNYITSKKADIGFRGDAIKAYYSNDNIFSNNVIENSRDVTLNYSHNNLFSENTFLNNRFSTHLSLSNRNAFKNNTYKYNSVAIMIMGAKDTSISGNSILSSKGAAGIGVMIKGVSNFRFSNNTVKFNAKGLYVDGQEKATGMKRYISDNEISYNGEALHFHATIKNNVIVHNNIFGNIEDVVKDMDGKFSDSNKVERNYWDRYAGFDKNGDNIGDNPHQVYQYADQLWQYNNKVKFFYASPIMTLLNFLSNLAPFIEPNLLLEDKKPIVKK